MKTALLFCWTTSEHLSIFTRLIDFQLAMQNQSLTHLTFRLQSELLLTGKLPVILLYTFLSFINCWTIRKTRFIQEVNSSRWQTTLNNV